METRWWPGEAPCKVDLEHMVDGEDLIADSIIESDDMLHFVFEFFNYPLAAAIGFQRLMSEMMIQMLGEMGDPSKTREIHPQG